MTFFTATLIFSIIGLTALISLKRWELTTGKVVWGGVRPKVGEFLHRCVLFFERVLPALIVTLLARAGVKMRAWAHAATAWGVLVVERGLESTLHGIRRKTSAPAQHTQSSEFFREVAEHKRKLQESAEPGAIFED